MDRFRAILVTHLHPQGEKSRLPIRPFRSPASRIPQSFPGFGDPGLGTNQGCSERCSPVTQWDPPGFL